VIWGGVGIGIYGAVKGVPPSGIFLFILFYIYLFIFFF
jgi:hypothetical protein